MKFFKSLFLIVVYISECVETSINPTFSEISVVSRLNSSFRVSISPCQFCFKQSYFAGQEYQDSEDTKEITLPFTLLTSVFSTNLLLSPLVFQVEPLPLWKKRCGFVLVFMKVDLSRSVAFEDSIHAVIVFSFPIAGIWIKMRLVQKISEVYWKFLRAKT